VNDRVLLDFAVVCHSICLVLGLVDRFLEVCFEIMGLGRKNTDLKKLALRETDEFEGVLIRTTACS
jgi:hypothetical protein